MDVLGDVVSRTRRDSLSDRPALRHDPAGRRVDYRRFCTSAWKAGNFLRNEGVRAGARVVVEPDPAPAVLAAVYGAGLLGATVAFGPDGLTDDARALVAPADRLDAYAAGPRTRRIAYGERHPDPAAAHFERDVWSENPTAPPDAVARDDGLLVAGGRTHSHGEVLSVARAVVEEYGLDGASEVVAAGDLARPGVFAAGFVAPLAAGGTVVVPDGGRSGPVVADGRVVDVGAAFD